MKSLIDLWQELSLELGEWCGTDTSMDIKTVRARFEHEGLSFLTITLPEFGKDLQKGLDQAKVDHGLWKSFSFKGGLPRFMGGFLDLVFDRGTGLLAENPSVDAIFALRQLSLLFSKIQLPCSNARQKAAIQGYLGCEQEIKHKDSSNNEPLLEAFADMSAWLWADILCDLDQTIKQLTIVPKHGPGNTADRLMGNQKFDQVEWTQRLEQVFPAGEFLLPNWRYWNNLSRVSFLEPGQERPVRVTLVPKTLKTPRVIALEPTCMQYAQQAIAEALVGLIERHDTLSSLVGFTDQGPNQVMAQDGSLSRNLATLDLSEASDRVSNQLVVAMCRKSNPISGEAFQACRSRIADVPGYGEIRLSKFASMGSALCFPIEAMVFLTIICLAIGKELNRPLTKRDIKSLKGQVRVYGDDIVVPVHYVQSVVSELEAYGFKVNAGKSFWNGRFRESCGKEYFAGYDVSIVKVRNVFPSRLQDVSAMVSMISLRNQLYWSGLWKTVAWLDSRVVKILRKSKYPHVLPTSPVLGRETALGYETQRGHPDMQYPEVRGAVEKLHIPVNSLDGEGALLKWFLKRGDMPFFDENHLERSGRPDSVALIIRWASAV